MADSKGYISKEQENGTINISEDVIATLAASAAAQVEGVKNPSLSEDTKLKKNLSKYVKVECADEGIKLELNLILKYGCQIKSVSAAVQDRVASTVGSVTGMEVCCVNVSVIGIAFDKEKPAQKQ